MFHSQLLSINVSEHPTLTGSLTHFSISAHPDPTLQPHHLDAFAKKLKRYYGWDEEDLLKLA